MSIEINNNTVINGNTLVGINRTTIGRGSVIPSPTSWTVPEDVFSVSVVLVGSGDSDGTYSHFNNEVFAYANGGGTLGADGGGNGGARGTTSGVYAGGGGGAGGYSGNGGKGGNASEIGSGTGNYYGAGGGGVGIYGEGASGEGGVGSAGTDGLPGTGGAGGGGEGAKKGIFIAYRGGGGSDGTGGGTSNEGGIYGGGKSTSGLGYAGGALAYKNNISVLPGQVIPVGYGGNGIVRIIWGNGRSFPSTDVID